MRSLLNLGKVLKKSDQKAINGGRRGGLMCCEWDSHFDPSTLEWAQGVCIDWEPIGRSCSFTA